MFRKEVWVQVKDHPRYLVSNLGNVLDRKTDELVEQRLKQGRLYVSLYNEKGTSSIIAIYRVMAISFFDVDPEGLEVNHIDGNRTNNELWNLEFISREDNAEHAYQLGLMRRPIKIINLDTGEVYDSLNIAGRRLGLINAIRIPERARTHGDVFIIGSYHLKIFDIDT